jgi:hypothetical protein
MHKKRIQKLAFIPYTHGYTAKSLEKMRKGFGKKH